MKTIMAKISETERLARAAAEGDDRRDQFHNELFNLLETLLQGDGHSLALFDDIGPSLCKHLQEYGISYDSAVDVSFRLAATVQEACVVKKDIVPQLIYHLKRSGVENGVLMDIVNHVNTALINAFRGYKAKIS